MDPDDLLDEEDDFADLGAVPVEGSTTEGDDTPGETLPGYHQARSRRVVQVDPVHITGTPDGMGTIRTFGGSHIEENAALDGLAEKDAPSAPPSERAYRDAVRVGEDAADSPDGEEHGILEDILAGGATLDPRSLASELAGGEASAPTRRMRRRVSRAAEEGAEDPLATFLGLAEGGSQHLLSEIAGGLFQTPELRAGQSGSRAGIATDSRPAHSYEEVRDDVQEEVDDARERSPYAFGAAELGGGVASGLALAPLEGAAATTGLGRVVQGARAGMFYGGANGLGASEHTIEDDPLALFADGAESALGGALGGGVISGGGEAVRGLGSLGRRIGSTADLQRVAAVGGGVSSPLGSRAVDRFRQLPGGIEGQAARLRRVLRQGATDTQEDVARRAVSAVEELGEGGPGPMGATRRRLAEEGREAPVSAVTEPLEAYAQELERSAERAPRAPGVRGRAQRYRDVYHPEAATGVAPEGTGYVPYDRLRADLTDMSRDVPWTGTGLDADVARGEREAMRGGLDDWIEGELGPEARAAYQEGRLDFQTALTAEDVAREALDRKARGSTLTLSDLTAMQGADSTMGALARYGARRAVAAYGGSGRAAATEAVQRMVESGAVRALGQYGPILQRALERGAPAFAATHATLARTDPEYAAIVEGLEEGDGAASDDDFSDLGAVPVEDAPQAQ